MATLNFALFVGFKHNPYFAVPSVVVAKLYSNTMLLILNNRIVIVGGREQAESYLPSRWSARVGSRWKLVSKSKRVDPMSSITDGVSVFTEVWTDAANSDRLEVVSASFQFYQKPTLHPIFAGM